MKYRIKKEYYKHSVKFYPQYKKKFYPLWQYYTESFESKNDAIEYLEKKIAGDLNEKKKSEIVYFNNGETKEYTGSLSITDTDKIGKLSITKV